MAASETLTRFSCQYLSVPAGRERALLEASVPHAWTVRPEVSLSRGRKENSTSGKVRPQTASRNTCFLRSRRTRETVGKCRAVFGDTDYEPPAWDVKPEAPKEYWFAVTEANQMLLHGPQLETVLRDAVERAESNGLPRNTWLVFEPAFLEEHPGLKGVKKDMKGQVAAIVSTNQDWMIQIVKPMLPGVVIGKFRFPSPYVKDPLASSIKASPNVPSGGGVWH